MVSTVNGRIELKPVTMFTGEKGPLALRTPPHENSLPVVILQGLNPKPLNP